MHQLVQCAEPFWKIAPGGRILTLDIAMCAPSRRRCLKEVASRVPSSSPHWDQADSGRVCPDRDAWRLELKQTRMRLTGSVELC